MPGQGGDGQHPVDTRSLEESTDAAGNKPSSASNASNQFGNGRQNPLDPAALGKRKEGEIDPNRPAVELPDNEPPGGSGDLQAGLDKVRRSGRSSGADGALANSRIDKMIGEQFGKLKRLPEDQQRQTRDYYNQLRDLGN